MIDVIDNMTAVVDNLNAVVRRMREEERIRTEVCDAATDLIKKLKREIVDISAARDFMAATTARSFQETEKLIAEIETLKADRDKANQETEKLIAEIETLKADRDKANEVRDPAAEAEAAFSTYKPRSLDTI